MVLKISLPLPLPLNIVKVILYILLLYIQYLHCIFIPPEMGGWEPTICGWELEVPHKLKLRGYAVTLLRVCYCMFNYTLK